MMSSEAHFHLKVLHGQFKIVLHNIAGSPATRAASSHLPPARSTTSRSPRESRTQRRPESTNTLSNHPAPTGGSVRRKPPFTSRAEVNLKSTRRGDAGEIAAVESTTNAPRSPSSMI